MYMPQDVIPDDDMTANPADTARRRYNGVNNRPLISLLPLAANKYTGVNTHIENQQMERCYKREASSQHRQHVRGVVSDERSCHDERSGNLGFGVVFFFVSINVAYLSDLPTGTT